MTFLVGCGAGFSGDRTDAAEAVVDELVRRGEPCALIFETLGERTLAAAQRAMDADPGAGYEPLLADYLSPVLDRCLDHGIPVLGNFGAANPRAACERIAALMRAADHPQGRMARVEGDDLRERLATLDLAPWDAEHESLPARDAIIAANAYLGAPPLAEALARGGDVVVTGRVADPALALAPLVNHFGWPWDDWDRLAAGALAGHLVECGAQVTGGYFADPGYKDVPGLAVLGYPIVEVDRDGGIVVTKPRDSGGLVTTQTVREQLLYEIHDPAGYVTPDVVIDLSGVEVNQQGPDRVAVTGVRGRPAPERLKTTVCYDAGWQGEAGITYAGPNALPRARLAAETLRERFARRLPADLRCRFDYIGHVSVFGDDDGTLQSEAPPTAPAEVRLRLAVAHTGRAAVETATQELLALYCTGPAGGGGVRRHHRRRVATVSFLVPRAQVPTRVHTLDAAGEAATDTETGR
ncbi:acyclic terpene utilization AtuA family protein [Arhodomonas aquaeolei]|uniref:acyclic terpene utilization AtuA family protein n=1 Tax=Arhodomonas aquaeolei TaxID=2369 RepID=UPI000374CD3B|nr:acyclic terpene utilization AtuA family protein [Arhodomonas aquaeolei]